jgi:hypothetical protein
MISALINSQEVVRDMSDEQHGGGLGFPSVSWAGRVPGVGGKGAFVITADQINGKYDETVLSDWQFGKEFIGGEMKEVYSTSDMNAVPVAWRTCWVKYGNDRRIEGRWGKYTKRTPEMSGSKTNTQVVLYLPSLKDYVLLGLSGVSKTVAWDNDQSNSRYSEFPLGIQQRLENIASAASEALTEQHGSEVVVAPNMTFLVTFTNFLDENGSDPKIFKVGSGDKTSQMFAPTIYDKPEDWERLYVGDGMYSKFVADYVETFKEWVAEWPAAGAITYGKQEDTAEVQAEPAPIGDLPF